MSSEKEKTTVTPLAPVKESNKDHHTNSGFRNPWPSAAHHGGIWNSAFGRMILPSSDKNNVPLPANREGLVKVRTPDFGGTDSPSKLKATWFGHASFLVETACKSPATRGCRVLFDPFFSDRCSPVTFLGPKRYTPTPCKIEELPWVDALVISHNHYDHLDAECIRALYKKQGALRVFCGLKNAYVFQGLGIKEEEIHEMDWWDAVTVAVEGVGEFNLSCTPAQHFSSRGPLDRDQTLWCSWAVTDATHRLYFAGDTGYRHVYKPFPTPEEEAALPYCPAFKEIGEHLGPFDLALLPIGLCAPRDFMSTVHAAPEDTVNMHADVRSKKSVGMHYGTVRGGISAKYEDVLYPPRRWKELSEQKGYEWGKDTCLMDVGETLLVD